MQSSTDPSGMGEIFSLWVQQSREWLIASGPEVLGRIALFIGILILFRLASAVIGRGVKRTIHASRIETSQLLENMIASLASKALLVVGLLIALSQIGINLAPLIAGFGVAGFILGFALQDTLSNFAAGLMILFYRPYDVGSSVEAGGVSGRVEQMSIVSTTIMTGDNQKIFVPNKKIWEDIIRNRNAKSTRRVDLTFGVGYDDDLKKTEKILGEILADHNLVLDDPAPSVKLHALGESSIDFIVRPWVNTADYWTVYWDVTREVKQRFDAEGISIPYPQRDVHLYEERKAG